ncbi:monooxygenase YjiB [Pseudonocardia ailaonensis]|uniref:Monooxygenase YjiB n=1 Tax=Pseudonocardia ailaonensis TaxID=367279 RepID=A0ABN2NNY3_9PSEU
MKPDQFDISIPGVWTDTSEFFASLLHEEPVYEFPDGQGYMISRYDDVRNAASHPELFSNSRPSYGGGVPEAEAILTAEGFPAVPTLSNNNPPSHVRFRRLVARVFSPQVVSALEPDIREIANTVIDDFGGRTEVDFVREYTDVFPSFVMADWLGVPRVDQRRFKAWSDDMIEVSLSPSMTPERRVECMRSYVDFQQYFAAIIEERRASPREDAVSLLVSARVDGERPLDVPEILELLRGFLIAGNDTTTNLLGGMMLLLLDHPEVMAEVRSDYGLIPALVEESLRFISPASWIMRTVERPTEVGGCPVSAGGRARLLLAAANRDGAQFEEPDVFDIHRDPTGHMAFGHGIHYCIGHLLARAEARIALEVLFDRAADIRLAVPRESVRQKPMPGVYALKGLPVLLQYS